MADATVGVGKTGVTVTLTVDTVTTVTFADNAVDVQVVTDGTAAVIYTTDGTTPTNPAVGTARNGYYIPALACAVTRTTESTSDAVKLLSSGTPTVTVERG